MKGKGVCNCLMWIAVIPQMYSLNMVTILVGDDRLHGEGARESDSSSGGIAITTVDLEWSLDVPKLQTVWIPHV